VSPIIPMWQREEDGGGGKGLGNVCTHVAAACFFVQFSSTILQHRTVRLWKSTSVLLCACVCVYDMIMMYVCNGIKGPARVCE
jgi:hypothetical protein